MVVNFQAEKSGGAGAPKGQASFFWVVKGLQGCRGRAQPRQTDRAGTRGVPGGLGQTHPRARARVTRAGVGVGGAARLERRSPTDGQPVTSPHGAPVRLEVSECGALLPPGEPTAQAPPLSCGKKLLEDPGRSLGGQPWDHPVHGPLQTQRDLTGKENDAHKERQEDDEASVAPKSHGTPAA